MSLYIAKIGDKTEDKKWDSPSKITKILNELEENKETITSIRLSENSINLEVSKALSERIAKLTYLENADFSDIFTGRCKEELPQSLFNLVNSIENKKILVLNLSDNAFGPSGVKSIQDYLKNCVYLQSLLIENCGLGPEGADLLAETLSSNKNLKLCQLRIGRNRLENKGAIAFGRYFKSISTMKEFVAFQNGIKEEGMRSLLEGLASNNELEVLKINDNIIKDTSFIELHGLINKLKKLKVIDLSDSGLGGENSLEIFNSLIKIDSLEEVYLNYNEIEEKEIQLSIADSLSKRKNKLKKLVLRGNEIKKSVFSRIASFQKVDELDCFSESEADEEEIQEMMRKMNIDK